MSQKTWINGSMRNIQITLFSLSKRNLFLKSPSINQLSNKRNCEILTKNGDKGKPIANRINENNKSNLPEFWLLMSAME